AGAEPDSLALGESALWVANRGDGTVLKVDGESGTVTDTIDVGGSLRGLAVDGGRVWVIDNTGGRLVLIDAASAQQVAEVAVGRAPLGLVVTDQAVWVTLAGDAAVARVAVS
ncbi:MAG TPA: hypothetical protein VF743_07580, partial [Acidimicrobiales bacterium]